MNDFCDVETLGELEVENKNLTVIAEDDTFAESREISYVIRFDRCNDCGGYNLILGTESVNGQHFNLNLPLKPLLKFLQEFQEEVNEFRE